MKRLGIILIPFLAVALYGQTPATIASISPSSVAAGSPGFTLTVTGTNFVPFTFTTGSQVRWKGAPLPTFWVSTTQLQATVSAALVGNAGTATVDVLNPNAPLSNPVRRFR